MKKHTSTFSVLVCTLSTRREDTTVLHTSIGQLSLDLPHVPLQDDAWHELF